MLKIELRPSRVLAGILTLAHGAAIAAVIAVSLPLAAAICASAILLVHWAYSVRRHALLLPSSAIVALEVSSAHQLSVKSRAGTWCECEVLGSTYVMPFMTVLNLRRKDGGGTSHLVLLPDNLHSEDFRKLRAWLRWKEDRAEK
jgi:toxin CptA